MLDWEFAHAGSLYTDLGNLTRFEREPTLVRSTVTSLRRRAHRASPPTRSPQAAPPTCGHWSSWPEGCEPNPVRELATELLLAQARSGDLHAVAVGDPSR